MANVRIVTKVFRMAKLGTGWANIYEREILKVDHHSNKIENSKLNIWFPSFKKDFPRITLQQIWLSQRILNI